MTVHDSTNTTDWKTPVIVSSVLICLMAVTIFLTLYGMYRRRHPWLVKVLVTIQARFIDDSKALMLFGKLKETFRRIMSASRGEIIPAYALKKLFDLQVIALMTPTCRTRAVTTRTGSLLSTNCFRFWRRKATASASINATLSQEQVRFLLQVII